MREIKLSRGLVALVDDADFDWLNQWKWSALKVGRKNATSKFYACRMTGKAERGDDKSRMVLMHRQIMGVDDGRIVDHRNLDTLDYQRSNLRISDQAGNSLNQRGHSDRRGSRFKGVQPHHNRWVASFRGKYLGIFAEEELAAAAYDRAAIAHAPEMALTNADMGMAA